MYKIIISLNLAGLHHFLKNGLVEKNEIIHLLPALQTVSYTQFSSNAELQLQNKDLPFKITFITLLATLQACFLQHNSDIQQINRWVVLLEK